MCGQFVQLNEAVLKTELRELVRRTVEDTGSSLNQVGKGKLSLAQAEGDER